MDGGFLQRGLGMVLLSEKRSYIGLLLAGVAPVAFRLVPSLSAMGWENRSSWLLNRDLSRETRSFIFVETLCASYLTQRSSFGLSVRRREQDTKGANRCRRKLRIAPDELVKSYSERV